MYKNLYLPVAIIVMLMYNNYIEYYTIMDLSKNVVIINHIGKKGAVMEPKRNKDAKIPSRKDVHFRKPSEKKHDGYPSTKDKDVIGTNKAALPLVKKTSSDPSASRKSKTGKPIENKSKKAVSKNDYVRNSPNANSSVVKTPAELSKEKALDELEKNLQQQLKKEIDKNKTLKNELRKKELDKIKMNFGDLFKGISVGLVFAAAVILIIIFLYYRSLSSYKDIKTGYTIRCYDYIDPYSTDEETLERKEARNAGKEKPVIELPKDTVTLQSTPYVPFSAVCDFLELSIAGDNDTRTVMTGNKDSVFDNTGTAVFTNGSREIILNGALQTLSSPALIQNDELLIPFEFFSIFVEGLDIETVENKNRCDISVTKVLEHIYFGGSSNTILETPDISDFTSDAAAIHDYTVDVSSYERFINPSDPDKYLLLVNVNNKLAEDYVPDDLTNVKTSPSRQAQQMRLDAAMALEALLKAADAQGFNDLSVTSGYRSYSHQKSIYNRTLEQNMKKHDEETARKLTAENVMYPGASEHQSGLCADLHNMSTPMQSYSNTDEYKWIREHCADFGFILRYPQTKENITGVKFEPWHLRFVGRVHAQQIMSSGLCLEEYLETYNSKTE